MTKVTIIDDDTLEIIEEYEYTKLINAKAKAEKKWGKVTHSEKFQIVYEKYWVKLNS